MDNDYKFSVGQTVRKKIQKDTIGTINQEPKLVQGMWWYRLRLKDNRIIQVAEDSIEAFSENGTTEDYFLQKSFSNRESFSRIVTFHKLTGGYRNNPTALKSSRTIFEPYQYKPLIKFLYSENERLLIADEVGLGKTIEAGHIMLEMKSRNPLKTALIICPKSLCIKWKRELEEKYSLYFEIIDKKRFLEFLDDYEKGNTERPFLSIVSYQSIRSIKVRDRLERVNPEFDMIIFDEMHWARNETSDTHKLAKQISELSNAVLGLTATPIMIGSQNLFNLLAILNPFEFQNYVDFQHRLNENRPVMEAIRILGKSDYPQALLTLKEVEKGEFKGQFIDSPLYKSILTRLEDKNPTKEKTLKLLKDVTELSLLSHIVTRTRKRDVNIKAERRARTYKVRFTPAEKLIYDAVTKFIKDKYSLNSNEKRATSFALMMPQRQVASCIPAMVQHYRSNSMFIQSLSELSDVSDYMEDDENKTISAEINCEVNKLIDQILSDEEVLAIDSKYQVLKDALKFIYDSGSDAKILIFSYFKASVRYLTSKLNEDGFSTCMISGDLTAESRQKIMDDFRNTDRYRILVSTEVGSEGIDLEFCSVIVNYDLPWNPMIVEQRIGRLDRIGQSSEVITIINFAVEETIEARILERLYDRINIFREYIGDLEDILGDEIQKLTTELLTLKLTAEEQEKRIEEAAEIILKKRIIAQQLQEQSEGILTNDEYFNQELNSIINERRYITSEELLIYINEYLKRRFPQCMIKSQDNKDIFKMYLSPQLETEMFNLFRSSSQIDEQFINFINKAKSDSDREIKLTFNSEFALKNRKVEFINSFHPLARTVTNYYRQNSEEMFPCSSVSLESSSILKKGSYFYFTFEISLSGNSTYRALSHIILTGEFSEIINESQTSEIISEILVHGETAESNSGELTYNPQEVLEIANQIATNRFIKIKKEKEELIEAIVQRQLSTYERIYATKITRKFLTIEEVKNDPARSTIVPALQGQINKWIHELERKREEIQSKRYIDGETSLIAAGLLIIQK